MAPPSSPRRTPATWVAAAILLIIGIAGTLIVPIYARSAPQWGPFPFFYWYQLIWVPVTAILAGIAYLLVRRAPAPAAQTAERGGEPE